MASDLARLGQAERDIEQAITALKKGAYFLKYGRRGKPKVCPFRLANDESALLWFSRKKEKVLKLNQVSRIVSGQRTPVFQRQPRPEKEYQSFSLIHKDGSLDLICKDKDEAEVWFSGLKALISRSHNQIRGADSRSDGLPSGANSPKAKTRKSSPVSSPFGSSNDSFQKDGHLHSPHESPRRNGLDRAINDVIYTMPHNVLFPSESASNSVHSLSSAGSDGLHGQLRATGADAFRVSLSSVVSSSSQGSGYDDGDALGDVFIWGEGVFGSGTHRIATSFDVKTDSLLPKPLESTIVLDVHDIACGKRHAALVTKQGEVFSWGVESGGRLGHGVDSDVFQPKLVETLSNRTVEFVACGEHHTCAVTLSGDLYTWGDGVYNFGLLGHGNDLSQWIPKRVNGALEGIHVSSISCGPWHTAVVTSAGQLFTFGNGTFGVLGHGDRESCLKPREVESIKGLRTVHVACGVWHTAGIVEVMVGSSSSSSGKLFTWGDGDKCRLGHGDKDSKLVPTCVAALGEPNFSRVACGQSMTVALATSGFVYTMGSSEKGQLGNPGADGKLPSCVKGKLLKGGVDEIACGAYHVAALTSRNEVYTWGMGANGRLGHGDCRDRNSPTLVEALKNKQVRRIACGTNFTAAVCLHKWVSGVDQSMCSGCRLPFNFKRKRHNCYNCGLLFCHSCSTKKSLKASMAPNPNKTYRVCDICFSKLKKIIESDAPHSQSYETMTEKEEKFYSGSGSQLARFSSMESLKQQGKGQTFRKDNKKIDFNNRHMSSVPNGISQRGGLNNIPKSSNHVSGPSKKFVSASVPGSRIPSRSTSPVSRKPSPFRSTTPTPTPGGLSLPDMSVCDAKTSNGAPSQEVIELRTQVENLTYQVQQQASEVEILTKQLKETMAIAGEGALKCKAAKQVIKSLTAQLKDMAGTVPAGSGQNKNSSSIVSLGLKLDGSSYVTNTFVDQLSSQITCTDHVESNGLGGHFLVNGSNTGTNRSLGNSRLFQSEAVPKNGERLREGESQSNDEWVEQDEPGVYITFSSLPEGLKELKRVRFSRRRFSEKQAEEWWEENRVRVYEQHKVRTQDLVE